ncbi:MAG: hypothetical protein CMF73_00005, partial [Maricaulis sp.]|nr:hypothetical protein [Maricaulis sp.]
MPPGDRRPAPRAADRGEASPRGAPAQRGDSRTGAGCGGERLAVDGTGRTACCSRAELQRLPGARD